MINARFDASKVFMVFLVQLLISRMQVQAETVCQQLEKGKINVDAIGFYGGTDGNDNFLVVTQDGNVFDETKDAFNPETHKVTLQEMTATLVTDKWPNLNKLYRPNEVKPDGAILRDEGEDWLMFFVERGQVLNQSLTHVTKSIYPRIPFEGFEGYQLVSSAPNKNPYMLGNSTIFQRFCLYKFSIGENSPWAFTRSKRGKKAFK